MAAAQQVFATPELLENILHYTSMRDLLRAQRVNKAVKDLIENSPKLQKALYLKPASTHHNGQLVQPVQNFLCIPPFGRNFIDTQYDRFEISGQTPTDNTAPALNENGEYELQLDTSEVTGDWQENELEAIGPKGGWRKMLVTQPPCELTIRFQPDWDEAVIIGKKTTADCVAMGELVDFIFAQCGKLGIELTYGKYP